MSQASPLVRHCLLIYVLLVVYSSLAPFSGWTDSGLAPLVWVNAPLPRYITGFDLLLNLCGYLPLGVLLTLALYPAATGFWAVAISELIGALLSGSMETLQVWLPRRMPSNLDFAANVAGTFIGAAVASILAGELLGKGSWRSKRTAWFEPQASFALVVVVLWPLAQAFPQGWLLGTGELVRQFSGLTDVTAGFPAQLDAWLAATWPQRAQWQDALRAGGVDEMLVAGFSWLGAGLFATVPMRAQAPRLLLLPALLVLALALKMAASGLQVGALHALDWLTPGGLAGITAGTVLLLPAAFLPTTARRLLAFAALGVAMLLVNLLPTSPYYLELAAGPACAPEQPGAMAGERLAFARGLQSRVT
ncbi:MAG: VanZ family protein [Candidatus Protistobacter heckmanni]|nr:VanZ family protein [Candidatus Protistobacter heckmanni]